MYYYYQILGYRGADICLLAANFENLDLITKIAKTWWDDYFDVDFDEWFESHHIMFDLPEGGKVSRIFTELIII